MPSLEVEGHLVCRRSQVANAGVVGRKPGLELIDMHIEDLLKMDGVGTAMVGAGLPQRIDSQ